MLRCSTAVTCLITSSRDRASARFTAFVSASSTRLRSLAGHAPAVRTGSDVLLPLARCRGTYGDAGRIESPSPSVNGLALRNRVKELGPSDSAKIENSFDDAGRGRAAVVRVEATSQWAEWTSTTRRNGFAKRAFAHHRHCGAAANGPPRKQQRL